MSWAWGGGRARGLDNGSWWLRWSEESGKQKKKSFWQVSAWWRKARGGDGEEGRKDGLPPLMLMTGWVTRWYYVVWTMPPHWHKHTSSGFEETLVWLLPLGQGNVRLFMPRMQPRAIIISHPLQLHKNLQMNKCNERNKCVIHKCKTAKVAFSQTLLPYKTTLQTKINTSKIVQIKSTKEPRRSSQPVGVRASSSGPEPVVLSNGFIL